MVDDNFKDDQEQKEKVDSKTDDGQGVSRRSFIKNSGIAAGGVVGGALLGGLLGNPFETEETTSQTDSQKQEKNPTEARMFFTRYEDFVVLEQATERIFPKDNNGPGAIELGVPYFIDKQLAGSRGTNANEYREGPFVGSKVVDSRLTRGQIFIIALRKMNSLSNERFDTPFNEAEEEQQMDILKDFEAGEIDMKDVDSSDFFTLLRDSTIEGAYADPLYGGNRNMDGWRMKEYPGSVASYADIMEQDEFVKMDPVSLTDYQQKS
ncbi:gluconate 2-dehydrogenase subunit 3 family protein [Virgibacillus sp. NKC19-3]|uniref:gluconate 2-dehydrogenase subunit 3 family protein n=1 Tax=Virgibacillus saliphilus TaxID=2831674 RepID=UPI001C9B0C69|nr:gluconate 2-dehydrogenase subunit 3 family protein [Virgibacillus sp. NKC19-3]MBY7144500.1 gluconate 2-dehydrogenase subunit 3 family protein [Virgibacillus sp. NKC19-3]